MRTRRGLPARAFGAQSFHAPVPTETDIVTTVAHDERRPYAVAAASYGSDVVRMLATDDLDDIRLQARCAFRFARLATEGSK